MTNFIKNLVKNQNKVQRKKHEELNFYNFGNFVDFIDK